MLTKYLKAFDLEPSYCSLHGRCEFEMSTVMMQESTNAKQQRIHLKLYLFVSKLLVSYNFGSYPKENELFND